MHLVFAVPSPAETGGGGGADYIAGLTDGLRENGIRVEILAGPDPIFPPGAIPIVDGMLLPTLQARQNELTGAIALIHHLAAAAGRDDASRATILAIERDMLPNMARIITTSAPVADRLQTTFGLTAHALPPGIRDHAPATPDPAAPIILSVGVLTRRKGHDLLIKAAARLVDLPWHLIIAGDTQRDPAHAAELRSLAEDSGIGDRLTLLTDPSPQALDQAWRRATVFALASRWEGYPSAIAEAMQRGVPVLATDGTNAQPILPPTAGALCPSEDMASFGKCLRRLLFDDKLRAEMAAAARSAGQALPRWPDRAREFIALLERPS